jgi:hypothetical protein
LEANAASIRCHLLFSSRELCAILASITWNISGAITARFRAYPISSQRFTILIFFLHISHVSLLLFSEILTANSNQHRKAHQYL